MDWEQLPSDLKVSQLIDLLVKVAVGAIEPPKADRYQLALDRTGDSAERMRIDLEYWFPLVRELRQAGKIPSAEEIRQKADSMASMSSIEIRKSLFEFEKEIKNR